MISVLPFRPSAWRRHRQARRHGLGVAAAVRVRVAEDLLAQRRRVERLLRGRAHRPRAGALRVRGWQASYAIGSNFCCSNSAVQILLLSTCAELVASLIHPHLSSTIPTYEYPAYGSYNSLITTIGSTPVIKLNRLAPEGENLRRNHPTRT